jgi:hypothetical protein
MVHSVVYVHGAFFIVSRFKSFGCHNYGFDLGRYMELFLAPCVPMERFMFFVLFSTYQMFLNLVIKP